MQLNETNHPLEGGMKYMRILCANGVITLIYLKKQQANIYQISKDFLAEAQ